MQLTIHRDDCADNPQEYAQSTMVCWHNRYNLGDAHHYTDSTDFIIKLACEYNYSFEDFVDNQKNETWSDLVDHHNMIVDKANRIIDDVIMTHAEKIVRANCVMLPVYMYEHSGVALNTNGYNCPWDSGRVGYIYYTNKQVCELFDGDRSAAERALETDVQIYGDYINGDIYGYTVEDDDGEVIDSCCGFIGPDPATNGIRESVIEGGNDWDALAEGMKYVY